MNAFDVLSDPVRRRTLELISQREHASGEIVKVVESEFGISQSAVSQHLRVLRETGFAIVRKEGAKRCYEINPAGFADVDAWLDQLRFFWASRMEALATEVERGKRSDRGAG
ncbi:ArsR/SmtB family transcription factor [Hoeflea prorocentri]|uniref:Metalloregulator ArsR/SmtB family transcription factor n=1 Tax=Hoeflea prorocentri TaxID=1922333 RepID=A0A9X3UMF3_9HYPH|nr:metalloregulator ArsR/SmtB family transcription factor [Hoeflea prorocentri]MCY6383347.1 metalloregulator ArsR/SmtB family transcription factor [Hoeflea prorocentri]MDA5401147.1 metalloregulator ArsR/SmtB family transcription factor [Hoeflea prorocentri]